MSWIIKSRSREEENKKSLQKRWFDGKNGHYVTLMIYLLDSYNFVVLINSDIWFVRF